MGKLAILALRIVLTMVLAGSLCVQAVMVPLLAVDLNAGWTPTTPTFAPRSWSSRSWES